MGMSSPNMCYRPSGCDRPETCKKDGLCYYREADRSLLFHPLPARAYFKEFARLNFPGEGEYGCIE